MIEQATLPLELVSPPPRDVLTLRVGESGWVVPWAMRVDLSRRCWLEADYSISTQPLGAKTLKVTREPLGWVVDITECSDEGWEPEPLDNDFGILVPVARLIR